MPLVLPMRVAIPVKYAERDKGELAMGRVITIR
jgi:hypothetical protein